MEEQVRPFAVPPAFPPDGYWSKRVIKDVEKWASAAEAGAERIYGLVFTVDADGERTLISPEIDPTSVASEKRPQSSARGHRARARTEMAFAVGISRHVAQAGAAAPAAAPASAGSDLRFRAGGPWYTSAFRDVVQLRLREERDTWIRATVHTTERAAIVGYTVRPNEPHSAQEMWSYLVQIHEAVVREAFLFPERERDRELLAPHFSSVTGALVATGIQDHPYVSELGHYYTVATGLRHEARAAQGRAARILLAFMGGVAGFLARPGLLRAAQREEEPTIDPLPDCRSVLYNAAGYLRVPVAPAVRWAADGRLMGYPGRMSDSTVGYCQGPGGHIYMFGREGGPRRAPDWAAAIFQLSDEITLLRRAILGKMQRAIQAAALRTAQVPFGFVSFPLSVRIMHAVCEQVDHTAIVELLILRTSWMETVAQRDAILESTGVAREQLSGLDEQQEPFFGP